jgi:hypothetical protein
MKPKAKKVCFVCGNPGAFVSWELDPCDETEFKCAPCDVDAGTSDVKRAWMRKLIEAVVIKKKARLVLQEAING